MNKNKKRKYNDDNEADDEADELLNMINDGKLMEIYDTRLSNFCKATKYKYVDLTLYLCQALRRVMNEENNQQQLKFIYKLLKLSYKYDPENKRAVDMLALYEIQFTDISPDNKLLDAGYLYKLTDDVLAYKKDNSNLTLKNSHCVWAFDNVFPSYIYEKLVDAFDYNRNDDNFWKQNNYALPDRGFFSFTHPLHFKLKNKSSDTFIDRCIEYVYNILIESIPKLKDALYTEWWAHCRWAGDGHQLHFDSAEEGRGILRHPICTAILYLSDTDSGPTLVTNQTRHEPILASKGWLAYPEANRVVVLDGQYLHSVIPSHAFVGKKRRTTLMLSFWEKNEMINPFPPSEEDNEVTWHKTLVQPCKKWWNINKKLKPLLIEEVSPLWIPLKDDLNITLPHYFQCYQGL